MRYVLLVLGVIGLGVSGWALFFGPNGDHPNVQRTTTLMIQCSSIFLAAGALGIDVVQALQTLQRRGE